MSFNRLRSVDIDSKVPESSPLLKFLACEALDKNLFRGQSRDFKTGQVYGGQVLGQAIKAAYETLDEKRTIHSAHAYFLRRGDVEAPIIYEVDRSLDGGSFSSRRVVAIQHGHQIFHLSASFQRQEEGLNFVENDRLPKEELASALDSKLPRQHDFQSDYFEAYFLPKEKLTCEHAEQYWMRAKHPLPDEQACHHSVLAYISDMGLLGAALNPHGLDRACLKKAKQKLILASLDHAIWFHREFRADEWLFYDCRPQSNSGGRGFAVGKIYSEDGSLVASTAQEGLMRLRPQD